MKLAIIGCGAVTEQLHLPAVLARNDASLIAAVDRNPIRAQAIAGKSAAQSFTTIAEALPLIDAAIVALPHYLHAPASIELLEAGKHVLVEKPMALTSQECDAMLIAAERGGASLTVGQMRRFCPAVAAAKKLLEHQLIGRLQSFQIFEGNVFNWPVTSDFQFRREAAGGGVLMDTGAHTLDMLLWLFGEVDELEYKDDAFGGVEADCAVSLTTNNGVRGYVELSRTRDLPGVLEISGDRGRMEVDYRQNQLTLCVDGQQFDPCRFQTSHPSFPNTHIWQLMIVRQLDDWIKSLRAGHPAQVPGEEGRKVVALIERCYRCRKPWSLPWVQTMETLAH